jgi:hypothetical protein
VLQDVSAAGEINATLVRGLVGVLVWSIAYVVAAVLIARRFGSKTTWVFCLVIVVLFVVTAVWISRPFFDHGQEPVVRGYMAAAFGGVPLTLGT